MPTLHWLTRETDLKASGLAPYRLLDHVKTYGDANTENILIQGDNLDGLKALLPYYAGKIKCIYIDPPYNTGSAFDHYDDNLEHTLWLSIMYPRLELLRELLADDGSIWVTLDDHEVHYIKIILDEIFGRSNFLAHITWQKKYSVSNNFKGIASITDHLLVYRKAATFTPNMLPRTEESKARYSNPDNDPRGPWKPVDYLNQVAPEKRPNLCYDIANPTTKEIIKNTKKAWKYDRTTHQMHLDENKLWWGVNGTNSVPALKLFLNEVRDGMTPHNWWEHTSVGHTDEAKKESIALFGSLQSFATPKPERLLQQVLHIATSPGDIVLDSFLGSGTTAAVAHKMGRRYIGIEIGEHATSHCIPRLQKVISGEDLGGISLSQKGKAAVTLCEECKESLCEDCADKVGKTSKPKQVWFGGGGFRFYRLGEPVFDDDGQIRKDIRFPQLAAHVWFSETKTPWQALAELSPFLGVHDDTAYYLLYNGILKDKSVNGGNVLTSKILDTLPAHDGPKVIYGERCLLSPARLNQLNISFKHTPYDIKGR